MDIRINEVSHSEWHDRWKNNNTRWHSKTVHVDLVKYEEILLQNKGKIFLPLCGKSVDLKYLAQKGHDVVGLELSGKAIVEFFEENCVAFSEKRHPKFPFNVYQAKDLSIIIYQRDIFQANKEMLGLFDAVWDRASFVAINIPERLKYIKIISSVLKENGRLLLNVFTYDGSVYGGPPHTINGGLITELFGSCFNITFLDSYSFISQYFKSKGLKEIIANNYILVKTKQIDQHCNYPEVSSENTTL